VTESKYYGCGRCLNSFSLNLISEYEYNFSIDDIASTLQKIEPNAVEIYTEINRLYSFTKVVSILKNSETTLDKVSISCGLNQSFNKSKGPENLLKAL